MGDLNSWFIFAFFFAILALACRHNDEADKASRAVFILATMLCLVVGGVVRGIT